MASMIEINHYYVPNTYSQKVNHYKLYCADVYSLCLQKRAFFISFNWKNFGSISVRYSGLFVMSKRILITGIKTTNKIVLRLQIVSKKLFTFTSPETNK